jgi:uncharacterized protein (DUF2252 family)
LSAPSIIDEINRVNRGRMPDRVALKYRRMGDDVFAFFRGTDHLFARDWSTGLRPPDPGPELFQCGDLHLENFGAYVSDDGEFLFDINDFDEALIAPCGFDLSRCVASILLAADVWKLSPVQSERMAVAYLEHYRRGVADMADPRTRKELPAGAGHDPVSKLLGRAAASTRCELLEQQTRPGKHGRPTIRGRKGLHPRLGKSERRAVVDAMLAYAQTTQRPEAYEVLSVRGRIAGIGSLGVRRYLVLTRGDGPPEGYWLLDLKESTPSVVRPFLGDRPGETWKTETERIVDAELRLLPRPSGVLGMVCIGEQDYRIRAMIPAENRTRIDAFQRRVHKLGHAVVMAGRITGWAHARGARFVSEGRYSELATWARGPGLESTLATAIRHATRARRGYRVFLRALKAHDARLEPKLALAHAT